MTVEEARRQYEVAVRVCARSERMLPLAPGYDQFTALCVDAASIALDMANAEASIERTRASIEWA